MRTQMPLPKVTSTTKEELTMSRKVGAWANHMTIAVIAFAIGLTLSLATDGYAEHGARCPDGAGYHYSVEHPDGTVDEGWKCVQTPDNGLKGENTTKDENGNVVRKEREVERRKDVDNDGNEERIKQKYILKFGEMDPGQHGTPPIEHFIRIKWIDEDNDGSLDSDDRKEIEIKDDTDGDGNFERQHKETKDGLDVFGPPLIGVVRQEAEELQNRAQSASQVGQSVAASDALLLAGFISGIAGDMQNAQRILQEALSIAGTAEHRFQDPLVMRIQNTVSALQTQRRCMEDDFSQRRWRTSEGTVERAYLSTHFDEAYMMRITVPNRIAFSWSPEGPYEADELTLSSEFLNPDASGYAGFIIGEEQNPRENFWLIWVSPSRDQFGVEAKRNGQWMSSPVEPQSTHDLSSFDPLQLEATVDGTSLSVSLDGRELLNRNVYQMELQGKLQVGLMVGSTENNSTATFEFNGFRACGSESESPRSNNYAHQPQQQETETDQSPEYTILPHKTLLAQIELRQAGIDRLTLADNGVYLGRNEKYRLLLR